MVNEDLHDKHDELREQYERMRRKRFDYTPPAEEVSVTDDLNLHFVIIINPNTQHSVLWFKTDSKLTKEFVFDSFKKIAKTAGDELLICDGILYQYDRSNGKWLKQRWEDVVFEPQ